MPELLSPIFTLDGLVHLLPMYGDFNRRRDPEAHFVAPDVDDCDHDIVRDSDAFIPVPAQD
jgi:hypothetical protein